MKNILFNSTEFKDILLEDKITLLDGGARGEIFPPFNNVNKDLLKIVRFEPDPNAKIITNEDEVVVPMGIWNKKATLQLNIAIAEAASSVYPFNTTLQKYIDPLKDKRKTKKIVDIECISIDEFINQGIIQYFDFIKLDIHASEYEAIQGAKNTLKNTLGLLVESWTIPIHKDQKIRADVEQLLYKSKFYLFEEFPHSRWARNNLKYSKKQTVSVDSLYFIDPLINKNDLNENQALKLIGFSDLFGHFGYTLQLADYFLENNLINKKLHSFIIKEVNKKLKRNFLQKNYYKLIDFLNSELNPTSFK